MEVDAAGLLTRTTSLGGVPDDADYFAGMWIGGIGDDGYDGMVLENGEEAFPDANGTAQAVTKPPWGVRLLGDAATRTKLLWFFQDALKQDPNMEPSAPSRLFVDAAGFLRISGDRIDEFKGLIPVVQPPALQLPPGDTAPPFPTGTSLVNDIGNLIRRESHQPVIEVALSAGCKFSEEHQHGHDCGSVGTRSTEESWRGQVLKGGIVEWGATTRTALRSS